MDYTKPNRWWTVRGEGGEYVNCVIATDEAHAVGQIEGFVRVTNGEAFAKTLTAHQCPKCNGVNYNGERHS